MNIASQKYPELNHQTASPKPSPLGYLAIQRNWKMLVILNILKCIYFALWDFPHGAGSKEPACQCRRQRDVGLVPGWGRSPGRGHGNPLQYSCLEKPIDGEARWAAVHRVAKSQTRLSY